jgi:hypothetical protein
MINTVAESRGGTQLANDVGEMHMNAKVDQGCGRN